MYQGEKTQASEKKVTVKMKEYLILDITRAKGPGRSRMNQCV